MAEERTDDTPVHCAVCGKRTTWGNAVNWSSRLTPRGERFYLCAEEIAPLADAITTRQLIENLTHSRAVLSGLGFQDEAASLRRFINHLREAFGMEFMN